MVVVRAAAVPALPERRCAEVDPSLTAGERALRDHRVADVVLSRRAERMHDELVAEHSEIKVIVVSSDLLDELIYKPVVHVGFVKPEIKHRARRCLAVAHNGECFFIEEFFAPYLTDPSGEVGIVFRVVVFAEQFCDLDDRFRGVIEERRIAHFDGAFVAAHVFGDRGSLERRAPISCAVIQGQVIRHTLHKVAVALYRVVVYFKNVGVVVVKIDVIRNRDESARPIGSHESVISPTCRRHDARYLTCGAL